jgi:NADP-dependent 3-hydroxy acid dehydrogenase YdfG
MTSGGTFHGKVAIVTGAASGIGAALARELAAAGAEVVLADRQVELVGQVAAEIRASGGRATAFEVDVRSLPALLRVVSETVARSGTIDYLFNNAGIAVGGEMDAYAPEDWDDVFDVNLRGVTNGIQAVYPVMVRQRTGHIVNTASVAGLIATPCQGSYTASKHAVVGLSKALRIEARRHGVRVSVLCPGVIRSPILTGGKYGRANLVGISEEKVLSMWETLRPMQASDLARQALRAVARDEGIIVIPSFWKALWLLERFAPSLSASLWTAALGRTRKQVAEGGGRPVRGPLARSY